MGEAINKLVSRPTQWGFTRTQERYYNDPTFHALVDTLYQHIVDAKYTPGELREACHLAACMYEDRHIRPMFFQGDLHL